MEVAQQDAKHWAYETPRRTPLPKLVSDKRLYDPLDIWIEAAIERAGLTAAREASREVLLRRVTLHLTGLPPTLEERERFLADSSPDAYERLVDRLLASPHYGQRMATPWLDLARYADTHGYHSDTERDMWRWRDWVIDALNSNLSYDEFTRWQLAGDLLPNATLEQKLATGLHRNHMLMDEDGSIPEEFLAEYIADRVAVTGTIWLGQTLACARCHDHKHDPISQRDYYEMAAFFSQIPENGLGGRSGNAPPLLTAPTRSQQLRLDQLAQQIEGLKQTLRAIEKNSAEAFSRWEASAAERTLAAPREPEGLVLHLPLDETEGKIARGAEDSLPTAKINGDPSWIEGKRAGAILLDGKTFLTLPSSLKIDPLAGATVVAWIFPTTKDRMTIASSVDPDEHARGWQFGIEEGRLFVSLTHKQAVDELVVRANESLPLRRWQQVAMVTSGGTKSTQVMLYVDGQPVASTILSRTLSGHIAVDKPIAIAHRDEDEAFRGLLDEVRIYDRSLTADAVAQLAGDQPVARLLKIARQDRTAEQQQMLRDYFLEHEVAEYRAAVQQLQKFAAERDQLLRSAPVAMVMQQASQQRKSFLLSGGSYEKPTAEVQPQIPAILRGKTIDLAPGTSLVEKPLTRLDLANWITTPSNPLTARVAVNRAWQMFFGTGIVKSVDDFGTYGDRPSHPELLDMLALDFVASGWDLKQLHRRIVTSSTFRRASDADVGARELDPMNRLLSYFPRTRLPAEMIRDQALAASSLMSHEQGGVGMKPYLPADLWKELAYDPQQYTAQQYAQSKGAELYKRSVYLFIKRSATYPFLLMFDVTSRETCTAARDVTRTPLQALVLLNDVAFVESARELATVAIRSSKSNSERITAMFRRTLSREASPHEIALLLSLLASQQARFSADASAAQSLIALGDRPADPTIAAAELASWTMIASTILNLDEVQRPR